MAAADKTKLANHEGIGEGEIHLDLSKSLGPTDYEGRFATKELGSSPFYELQVRFPVYRA